MPIRAYSVVFIYSFSCLKVDVGITDPLLSLLFYALHQRVCSAILSQKQINQATNQKKNAFKCSDTCTITAELSHISTSEM
jgi:hypothetical protein